VVTVHRHASAPDAAQRVPDEAHRWSGGFVRTVTVEGDLIAGKLLFLTADFTLHKAQLAMVVKTHFHVFGVLL
jgi:hypothetical protein